MNPPSFKKLWEHPAYQPSESEINASVEAVLDRIQRHERHLPCRRPCRILLRRGLYAAALWLLPLVAAVGTYLVAGRQPAEKIYLANQTYSVPPGQKREFLLADGTRVTLNAGSLLVAPEEFTGATRPVYLAGEAYFRVSPDKARPFIVHTALVDVEAVGTAFCVAAYPQTGSVRTTLSEGKVRLSVPSDAQVEPVFLVPAQQSYYTLGQTRFQISDVPIAPYTAWKDGQIVFDETAFTEVVSRLQLQYNVRINYPPRLSSARVTAKFIHCESLDDVLSTLSEILYFRIKREGDQLIIE